MRRRNWTRRQFVRNTAAGVAGASLFGGFATASASGKEDAAKPAVLGGKPVRTKPWPRWPRWYPKTDEPRVLEVLRSGVWSRKSVVEEFERKWAAALGAKRCLATTNGTHALITALRVLDVGPGDEVLTTPYTFIATIDAILLNGAMPVFVDVDPETFQIDPSKIEAKITDRTRAILPVHILGLPADMPKILSIARKHNLKVVEDACQAHLAEIRGKKVGTFGDFGAFSFQNSKNLPIGEGGALVSDDDALMDRAFSFHNFGRPYGTMVGDVSGQYVIVGTKCRTTEYQAAIGLAQLRRLEPETRLRHQNAEYLKSQIQDIPGILPYRLVDGVTLASFHLFPFRIDSKAFGGLSRDQFLKALQAEGVPCSGGYRPLNTMPYLKDAFTSRLFQAFYSKDELDFDAYVERNRCPANDRVCDETVWLPQYVLLGTRQDMDDIARAIRKIREHAEEIAQA